MSIDRALAVRALPAIQWACPSPAAFKALYDTTGWGPRDRPADFYAPALAGSWAQLSAWDGERLCGFARVISDGRLHAFITEMIIAPDWQGRGLGAALLNALIQRCLDAGITDIQLFCARGKLDFYRKQGFEPRPDEGPGMQYVGRR